MLWSLTEISINKIRKILKLQKLKLKQCYIEILKNKCEIKY